MIDETQLAENLICIAVANQLNLVISALSTYQGALYGRTSRKLFKWNGVDAWEELIADSTIKLILIERHLVHYTEAGYMLNEPAATQFIKTRFNIVLDSLLSEYMSIDVAEVTYMFSLLNIFELPAYLSHSETIVREAAKARFDQLTNYLEVD